MKLVNGLATGSGCVQMTSIPPLNGPAISATFDGTVFRPNQPVSLPANTKVMLIVESAASDKASATSFLDTAAEMKLPGPADWATNLKDYLYGDRRDAAE